MTGIGFCAPPLACTCWNMGSCSPDYADTDHGKEWSHRTARSCAHNLFHVAQALREHPILPNEEDIMSPRLGDVAAAVGKGLFAGVAGTAAMTVSSTLEMKLRGRPASSAPAQAAQKVLGVRPVDERAEARFSNLVHWGYGTGWGGVRGLIAAAGLPGPAASAAHLAAVWGAEQVMLPALDVAPPLTEWGAQEVAIDAFHHLVYAAATGVAYSLLDRA